MSVSAVEQLGPSTLNRDWRLQVDVGSPGSPTWIDVRGRAEFQPGLDPTLQEDSDFDGGGYKSQTVTALAWTLSFKVARKVVGAGSTAYDAGQEALRLAANEMGVANSVHVRWFEAADDGPRTEAYEGFAAVSWSPDGGGMDALTMVSVTLTGQGQRLAITNPAGTTAPSISSLTPNTAVVAGGTLVMITGTGFTGATAVNVDGVAVSAADWELASSTKIALKAPAKSAGARPVVVVTPSGTSAGSTLTYS